MDMSIVSFNFSRLVAIAMLVTASSLPVLAQDQTAPASAAATSTSPPASEAQAPEPLSDDELEVLVARIALYPDRAGRSDFRGLAVSAADRGGFALPGQACQGQGLQPKDDWDGSVISLLNYPEVVKMMSDDLEWTQAWATP